MGIFGPVGRQTDDGHFPSTVKGHSSSFDGKTLACIGISVLLVVGAFIFCSGSNDAAIAATSKKTASRVASVAGDTLTCYKLQAAYTTSTVEAVMESYLTGYKSAYEATQAEQANWDKLLQIFEDGARSNDARWDALINILQTSEASTQQRWDALISILSAASDADDARLAALIETLQSEDMSNEQRWDALISTLGDSEEAENVRMEALMSTLSTLGFSRDENVLGELVNERSDVSISLENIVKLEGDGPHSGDWVYVVQPGDNLTRLSEAFDVTIQQIASLNAIENVDLIYAYSSLLIPVVTE